MQNHVKVIYSTQYYVNGAKKCALKDAESCEEDTQEDQIHVKSSSVKKCALKDAESCEEYTQEDQIHVKSSRIT